MRTFYRPIVLIAIAFVVLITNCKTVKKTTNDKELHVKSSVENFDEFYNRFHADSVFQMERIKFPLKGIKVDWKGKKKWSKKNWITMKTKIYDVDTIEFRTDYKKTDDSFMEKFWVEDSGYYSEYRFNLIKKKWYLVYAREQNL